MRTGAQDYGWKLNFGEIAQIWRGGCIIRAAFLQKITEAYARKPDLANLLLDPYFNKTFKAAQANWRKVIALAAECGVPAPTFSASLAYYDGYRSARLPGQPAPGPARLLRGAHLRARRPAPREILPPRLARPEEAAAGRLIRDSPVFQIHGECREREVRCWCFNNSPTPDFQGIAWRAPRPFFGWPAGFQIDSCFGSFGR